MKKTISTFALLAGILCANTVFAADGDTSANEVKAKDMRRALIDKYKLNEYQAVKLKPIVVTYVTTVNQNKEVAEQGFKDAFFKLVGKPYTNI